LFIIVVFLALIIFVGVNRLMLIAMGVAVVAFAVSVVKARQDRVDRGEHP